MAWNQRAAVIEAAPQRRGVYRFEQPLVSLSDTK
jgi:hypothetical protein